MKSIIGIIVCQYLIISFSHFLSITAKKDEDLFKTLDPKSLGLEKPKFSHFRVYWHDIYSGSKPSVMTVVKSPVNSVFGFGAINMIDDPLTQGPEVSSKLLGRAQGLYGDADQSQAGLVMVMNFVFLEGKYNGSTLSIVGRNSVANAVREMSIVGGSGLFRFARGYVQASTYSYNETSGDATVEYNGYVMHY